MKGSVGSGELVEKVSMTLDEVVEPSLEVVVGFDVVVDSIVLVEVVEPSELDVVLGAVVVVS